MGGVKPWPPPGLYERSLKVVKQSRFSREDYGELVRCLRATWRVPGDCVEFGTFWGHSGWLTARLLGGRKRLWLYDTFGKFPEECMDVDRKWTGTHKVDFAEVRRLFAPFRRVRLVRGDFTETAKRQGPRRVSFALVDCDSYRGTSFAAEWCWRKLACGGRILFHDHGKPHCRGATLAVEGFLLAHPEARIHEGHLLEVRKSEVFRYCL